MKQRVALTGEKKPVGPCPRGSCHWNPNDPNAPEFGKQLKIEHHSQLGRGTNIDVATCGLTISEPTVVRSTKTRQDYI